MAMGPGSSVEIGSGRFQHVPKPRIAGSIPAEAQGAFRRSCPLVAWPIVISLCCGRMVPLQLQQWALDHVASVMRSSTARSADAASMIRW